MRFPFATLDVFTNTRFTGNPVAVVRVPAAWRDPSYSDRKQKIAIEFNLSETVFLHEESNGVQDSEAVAIDIFTPIAEVPFAGHPTVGTASYLLVHTPSLTPGVQALTTKAGLIPISDDKSDGTVAVAVPHNVRIHNNHVPTPISVTGTSPLVSIVKGMTFALVEMPSIEILGSVSKGPKERPYEPEGLDEGWNVGFTGTYYYVRLGSDARGRTSLRTRSIGSREDPGTGSAASALCSYLSLEAAKDGGGAGREFEFAITQGLEMGRRCEIFVKVVLEEGGNAVESVTLSGSAVVVLEGEVNVD